MLDKLKEAPKKIIGTKQTLKAVNKDQVKLVFIAKMQKNMWFRPLKKFAVKKALKSCL